MRESPCIATEATGKAKVPGRSTAAVKALLGYLISGLSDSLPTKLAAP